MEYILLGIFLWLALGALHIPFYKYWWTEEHNWTARERRFSRWGILFGLPLLIVDIICVALILIPERDKSKDNKIITPRRNR
jgi:hypothetical protein